MPCSCVFIREDPPKDYAKRLSPLNPMRPLNAATCRSSAVLLSLNGRNVPLAMLVQLFFVSVQKVLGSRPRPHPTGGAFGLERLFDALELLGFA